MGSGAMPTCDAYDVTPAPVAGLTGDDIARPRAAGATGGTTMRVIPPVAALTLALTALSTAAVDSPAHAAGHGTVFGPSAVEHADHTVTLPVHRGEAAGQPFWYVVLDASTSKAAD